jgi:hypothetical protein
VKRTLRPRLSCLVLVATMLATSPQSHPATAAPASSDDPVYKLLMLALDSIQRGICENKQPCAPATAEEKADPPITIAEARIVVARAVVSAGAEHCNLDWRGRNFNPMMAYWRNTLKKNERQMTLIALLHGITQGFGKRGFKVACNDEMRANVDRQLTFQVPSGAKGEDQSFARSPPTAAPSVSVFPPDAARI